MERKYVVLEHIIRPADPVVTALKSVGVNFVQGGIGRKRQAMRTKFLNILFNDTVDF